MKIDAPTSEPSVSRRVPAAVVVVGLLALCAGINTLGNDFAYDDFAIIVNNPAVIEADRSGDIWTQDYWAATRGFDPDRDLLYRPLTVLTYRLNFAVGGLNPFGYHLVNVLLHALVSMLLAVFAIRAAGGIAAGIIAGSVFAVMPIHTEAIANVVGRAELLVALFALIALLLVSRRNRPLQPLTIVGIGAATLAALLSKESGVAVIALAPIFAFAFGDRFRRQNTAWAIIASGAALLAYLPLRSVALDGRLVQSTVPSKVSNVLVDASLAERFWSAWQLIGLYVAKTFWPQTLCMDYSYNALPPAHSPFQFAVILGLVFVIALIALTMRSYRRGEFVRSATCLAILICYLPVSNTFFLIKTIFAERVWYAPSIFLTILIGSVLARFAGFQSSGLRPRRPNDRSDPRSTANFRIAIVALLAFAISAGLVRGWVRNAEWRDNGTLFALAYEVHPDSAAVLYCYGQWLADRDDPRGIALLERCVRIAPGVSDAQIALGRAYLRMGAPRRALAALQAAAMHVGDHPDVKALLDDAVRQITELQGERIDRLLEKFTANGDWQAFADWTNALTVSGRIEDAIAAMDDSADKFADRPAYHSALAVNLMLSGRRDQAIDAYRKSLELNPNQPDVQAELATALMDRRRGNDLSEAQDLIEQAVRSSPDNVKVMIVHAEWLVTTGRSAEAIAAYQTLIKRLPAGELRAAMITRMEMLERQ